MMPLPDDDPRVAASSTRRAKLESDPAVEVRLSSRDLAFLRNEPDLSSRNRLISSCSSITCEDRRVKQQDHHHAVSACVHAGAAVPAKGAIAVTLSQLGPGGWRSVIWLLSWLPDLLFRLAGQLFWAKNSPGARILGYAA